MTDDTKAVLMAIGEELLAVARDQQRLADDLVELMGPMAGAGAVRRMQEFDSLRQRLDLLAQAVGTVAEADGSGAGIGEAVMARMTMASVRAVFARHLGHADAEPAATDDVELF